MTVKKKCERSMKKMPKGRRFSRHVCRLCLRKSDNCRREAHILEEEIQALQAGEERRGSCASQSNECCFDPAMVEQFTTMGAAQALQQLEQSTWRATSARISRSGACGRRRRKKEWEGDWEKAAPQWILLWILLGAKMQTVEALEEGIPAHQEMESGLLTALFLRGREKTTWKVTDSCDEGWREGEHWQKEKTAKERTQRPFKKTVETYKETTWVRTQQPMKKTARERTHAPLKAEAIRRKDGEFRQSGRKRKRRKKKKKKKNEE